ncbi:hypothetical protein [Deinococcus hopiensis]|uniref:Uncharacterized protein n=1 Tax=Deinococcus hopiensis KR-140 TaxID=695939 RepID=A0A1W1UXI7_9DEIO|nr:hypothetical protein [Deinococcus hopiensis]SMB85471.1 hypothetical protein SAMN00790413_03416 [Deinococcus hopiensis KR-140]
MFRTRELAITRQRSKALLPWVEQNVRNPDPRYPLPEHLQVWYVELQRERWVKNEAAERSLLHSALRRLHVKGC